MKKIISVMCIALGLSTATEVTLVPFILMGAGLLLLASEVTEWE